MSPEEMAGSIEIAFGVWIRRGPKNPVLDGRLVPLTERGTFGGNSQTLKHLGHWLGLLHTSINFASFPLDRWQYASACHVVSASGLVQIVL